VESKKIRVRDCDDDLVTTPGDPSALLARESRALVERLRLWTPTRWAAAAPVPGTRADVVHHLAQALADAAADHEGRARRPLPRLDSDLALPDQLAVTADDLVRSAPPEPLARDAVLHLLLHRHHLLGDDVPDGLARVLGQDAPLDAGARTCRGTTGATREDRLPRPLQE